MESIVCLSRDRGIGLQGDMLFHLRADLKRFRTLTLGKTLIMGRATLQSLPGGKPLPQRRNIVLSRNAWEQEGVECVHSVAEAMEKAGEDAVVIGGEQIYALFLPYCERLRITWVDAAPMADRFFPDFAAQSCWQAEWESDWQEEDGLRFRYVDYRRQE